jgi:hypothetical protein
MSYAGVFLIFFLQTPLCKDKFGGFTPMAAEVTKVVTYFAIRCVSDLLT